MEIYKKKISEIDLFDFTSFFGFLFQIRFAKLYVV
jgi:hypothetical protein